MPYKIMIITLFIFGQNALADTLKAMFCPSTITIKQIGFYLQQPNFIWVAYNDEGKFFSSYPFTRLTGYPVPRDLNYSLTAYNPAAKVLMCTYNVTNEAQPVTMQNRGDY